MDIKTKKLVKKLQKRLSEASNTNGQSLHDIEDWNNYHDEQTDIEQSLGIIGHVIYKNAEHYAR